MDTSGFSNTRDGFPILDFVAQFVAKTDTSVSFHLGRWGNTLDFADSPPMQLNSPSVFTVFGWIDVHHPCQGHIRLGFVPSFRTTWWLLNPNVKLSTPYLTRYLFLAMRLTRQIS